MISTLKKTVLLLFMIVFSVVLLAQEEKEMGDQTKPIFYLIVTQNNSYVGTILEENPREILIATVNNQEIYIPQYEIKKIRPVKKEDYTVDGRYIGEDMFSSRYFLTSNAFPLRPADSHVRWNLWGPEFDFGLKNDLSMGVSTSWLGIPIIVNAKKSWQVGNRSYMGVGALAGYGSWAAPSSFGVAPTAQFSFGDRTRNFSIGAGYAFLKGEGDYRDSRPIVTSGGMAKISDKLSLLIELVYVAPGKTEYYTTYRTESVYNETTMQWEVITTKNEVEDRRSGVGLVVPAIRWHQGEGKAFQFGFAGGWESGSSGYFAIPMIQWLRSL